MLVGRETGAGGRHRTVDRQIFGPGPAHCQFLPNVNNQMIKVRFWESAVYQDLPALDQKMGGMREAKIHEYPQFFSAQDCLVVAIMILILEAPSRLQESTMTNSIERITINPDQCGGRPCIRGMRIRVIDILDLFAAGLNAEQIMEELPDLEMEDIKAAMNSH